VDRTRDFSFTAKVAALGGLILLAILLLGAQPGSAEPKPVGPTGIAQPTEPPSPKPCPAVVKCLPPLQPCLNTDHVCQPPTTLTPTKPPSFTPPPKTTTPPVTTTTTTATNPATPSDPPVTIPTPNRIDTGGGSTAAPSQTPTWLFWVIPGMALLAIASGLTGAWMARSEQDRR
jgi:hypothetical protein